MVEDKRPEILESLRAGSHPFIYVIDQNDSIVRIQDAEDPKQYVDVIKSSLPRLIEMLQRVNQRLNRS
jgi:hypothetical protein